MRTAKRTAPRVRTPVPAAAETTRRDVAPLGQAAAVAAIDAFLDAATRRPTGLVIEGETGVGKSALLQAGIADARTRGVRILASRPTESESGLAFAGLGDLLDGTIDAQSGLPSPQLRALRIAALLENPGPTPPDQRAISVAVLTLIRSLAAHSPVLVAIDDAQCLDPPTARVLQFVLRRLETEPVGLLASRRHAPSGARSGLGDVFMAGRPADVIAPAPLELESLDVLLRDRIGTGFSRPVLRQIATASGGNPLFALELARAIGHGEIRPNPAQRLAVPRTLHELVEDRLGELPVELRDLLFVVAAVPEPNLELLGRFEGQGDVAERLREAVANGVVAVDGQRIRFTHPLFGSTMYHNVDPDRRRALHRRLATLVRGSHERARQLSLSSEGPDRAVAEALDEAASAAAAQGAPDSAADLAEEALRLTPATDRGPLLARRLQAAAFHFAAGDTARARIVLERLVKTVPKGPIRADVLRRLATVRYRSDSTSIAADLLARALDEAEGDDQIRAAVERDLAWAVTLCGDVAQAERHAESALRLVGTDAGSALLPELLAAHALARFLRGHGIDTTAIERAVMLELPSSAVPVEWRPRMILGMVYKWAGDVPSARAQFGALHREAVEAGDEVSLPFLLSQESETETLAGSFEAALDLAHAAQSLAIQTAQEPIRAFTLYASALAEAHLGRLDAASATALEGLRVAEAAGSVVAMMLNQAVLGFVELSRDEPALAHARLGPLAAWLEVVGIREPGVIRFVPDAVEALVALGQLERANDLLTGFEADGARLHRGWAMLAASRARAIYCAATGHSAAGVRDLESAIAEHRAVAGPFEAARALLVLGTVLRRTRKRKAARASLTEALDLFESLQASTWSARARALLGSSRLAEGESHVRELTASERRVVELVTAGSTNREAADRLFVSVRAVEVHLTNVYRKLGVRSRTELAALLAGNHPSPGTTVDARTA